MIRMEIDTVEEINGLQYVSGRTMAGERLRRVLRAEPHGAASSPPIGSVGLCIPMGGDRTRMVCVASETPGTRPVGLGAGHTVIYENGDTKITLADNTITLKASMIVLESPSIKLGSAGASRELALKDSVDDATNKIIGDLATKVFAE